MNVTIQKEEVTKELKNLNPTKALEPDNIRTRVLKECVTDLTHPITSLFHKAIRDGTIHSKWKSANIAPIKKGRQDSKKELSYFF